MKPRLAVLLAVLAVWAATAAHAVPPPMPPEPVSVVVTEPTALAGPLGTRDLKPGDCLDLVQRGPRPLVVMTGPGGRAVKGRVLKGPKKVMGVEVVLFGPDAVTAPWWAPTEGMTRDGNQVQAHVLALGRLAPGAFAPLPGPARAHRERLARLATANVDPATARRLMAGIIQQGDTFWLVELAWGRPQRSFMVDLIMDEQHYIYLGRGPKPIILRFEGGRLVPPLPSRFCRPGPAAAGQ